ncbi:DNA repair protein RecN [Peptoniphilus stercorisuis]|uniref:DNA repair protein RecN n=1 Tax=Peptoniphilus stercorisuis TaxID=1436965 RepID=A0ABS4KB55_9FIRM|nr:DNA repair protein RecN [Peptoniphilus stercorisuis]MBP2024992.1 DNA repair protein RecN (Recombination protein N) [Peptoniphilus stercorisuis]
MLLELNIKNFAIIEDLKVDFEKGLNVITGETGSGKSIIIDALSIVLGQRASKDIIKTGKDYAYIEAVFSNYNNEFADILKEYGLVLEELIVISKEIKKDRPSITKINGRTITTNTLSKITNKLIDVFAQHENVSLMNSNNQKDLIDSFGDKNHLNNLEKLKESIDCLHKLEKEYDEKSLHEKDKEREIDLLKYQIEEIENASLTEEDDSETEREYKKLLNISSISKDLYESIELMRSNYDSFNIEDALDNVISNISMSIKYDDTLKSDYEELENIRYSISSILSNIEHYINSLDYNEEKLSFLENRVNTINNLKKKYGNTINDIEKYLLQIKDRLNFLENFDQELKKLEDKININRKESLDLAIKIQKQRREISDYLEENVKNELRELNIENARFKVEIKEKNLSVDGIDHIEFMISTNLGEDFKPLSKTASGGEMSRIMLGFKSIIAKKDNIPTLIFDEIDTGISGKTAQIVGNKIKKLSEDRQIIAISHLPQIVSLADAHYLIEKEEKENHTTSNIEKLNENRKVEELARLIGGYDITETALKAAREMLLK